MDTWIVPVVLIVCAVLLIGAFLFFEDRRRARLRAHFGRGELARVANEVGGPRRAERLLEARARRVASYRISALDAADRTTFAGSWNAIQAQFVDDPAAATRAADRLVLHVMRARGFPESDLVRRDEDLSAAFPEVIEHYRSASAIATREQAGHASTEELRQALVHYRELFRALLEEERIQAAA
jgi:hypothetical protein